MKRQKLLAYLLTGAVTFSAPGAQLTAVFADQYDEEWLDNGEMTEEELEGWVDYEGTDEEFYEDFYYVPDYDYDDYDDDYDDYDDDYDDYDDDDYDDDDDSDADGGDGSGSSESSASTAAAAEPASNEESTASPDVKVHGAAAEMESGTAAAPAAAGEGMTAGGVPAAGVTGTAKLIEQLAKGRVSGVLILKTAGGAAALTEARKTSGAAKGKVSPSAAATMAAATAAQVSQKAKTFTPEEIETALNLKRNPDQEWTYDSNEDAWTLSVVSAVANPEIPEQEGVSICVPGGYVTGIDTNGDGTADVTATGAAGPVKGSLVIDRSSHITSTNGQYYTAETAPVIIHTGAPGYSASENTIADGEYAADGYINVVCGNRGKQSQVTDAGGARFTGDAPSCLADQKSVIRFVKYNILLGNLPGNVDYFISTGGSGGGAHAVMVAATSNHPDFYDYQAEVGAVGVYKNDNGSFNTTVTVNGKEVNLSDGVWGCIAYSPITSLKEADMSLAFEYNLNPDYGFNTSFQKQLASLLSDAYMQYINGLNLVADEAEYGFDLDGNGSTADKVALTIEKDAARYGETNGYGGTYLTLYQKKFISNLQWYLDNLSYAEDWTWFDEEGKPLTDVAVSALTQEDKARAFIEGRYANEYTGGMGGHGPMAGGFGPDAEDTDSSGENNLLAAGPLPEGGEAPEAGATELVGTPSRGTTQAAGSGIDSASYASYDEMKAAYKADVAEIAAGDRFGNNIVDLYDPMAYIGAAGAEKPAWVRMMMGAAEGDMSMLASMNLELGFLANGTDATAQWQWDGGHVPDEIFDESFSLYVDEMYGSLVPGAISVTKQDPDTQTANGTEEEANGTDLSSWVTSSDLSNVSFSLADIAAYRTAGASKAMPGFDVIDYGQEDYVFGSSTRDARHWDQTVADLFEANADLLSPLFNSN